MDKFARVEAMLRNVLRDDSQARREDRRAFELLAKVQKRTEASLAALAESQSRTEFKASGLKGSPRKLVADALKALGSAPTPVRLKVNKKSHRIRFDNETEDEVEIVIEPL